MNRLLPARRWIALAVLMLACTAPSLWPRPASAPAAEPSAYLLVSANTCDDLDVDEARRRLDSPDHARYRQLAGDVLRELGVRQPRVTDALGEWQGTAENSLVVSIHEPIDAGTIACAAAVFGLAAKQKAVLAFHAGRGDQVLAVIEFPGQSLEEARELLDQHGFPDRTMVSSGGGGWKAVVLAEGSKKPALARVPGAKVRSGRAVMIGAPTADGASERYREVIRAHRANAVPVVKLGW